MFSLVTEDGVETHRGRSLVNPYRKEILKYQWARATHQDRLYSRIFVGSAPRDGGMSIHWLEAVPLKGAPGRFAMNYCSYVGEHDIGGFLDKSSLASTDWSEHRSARDDSAARKEFSREEAVQAIEKFERDFTTVNPVMGCPTPRNGPARVINEEGGHQPFKELLALPSGPPIAPA